jgi:hypothetical protein
MRYIMKKILTGIAIILVILTAVAFAQAVDTDQYTLLGGARATGAGTPVALTTVYNTFTCQVNVSGSPTEVIVYLEGNITGSTYSKMASWTLSTDTDYANGQGMFSVTNMPAGNIRGRLVTLTGGTSPKVTMICKGVLR